MPYLLATDMIRLVTTQDSKKNLIILMSECNVDIFRVCALVLISVIINQNVLIGNVC